ncbi:membrane hypothetical protein [Frankia sp. AiPs1]|uniref:phosphatase PAP2 family protein n=1 Tax=Frankia sp. AiPa1 TaxID=573492 RepID=UPI00202B740B|nr:phosphatase PAP2 family protein [Frankia sp. AiPa1]MCL9761138.1 phosphatase PAP2 family protein [Frankia sp. AiPa1]
MVTAARTGGPARVRAALVAGLFALAPLPLAIAVQVSWSPLTRGDADVVTTVVRMTTRHSGWEHFLVVVSAVCAPNVWRVLAVVAATWLWWRARGVRGAGVGDPDTARRLVTFVLVAVEGGGLLVRMGKEIVRRPRPPDSDPGVRAAGFSFPSGHAFGVLVAAVVLLVAIRVLTGRAARPALWCGCAAVVALTGFARVGLGVHYLSDVVAGYLLGAAWALGLAACFRLPLTSSPSSPSSPS